MHTSAVGRTKPQTAREIERAADAAVRSKVQELCQEHTQDAVLTLVDVMHDKKATGGNRIMAAKALLEYGYGRPQAIERSSGPGGLTIVIAGQSGSEVRVNGQGEEHIIDV